MAIVPETGSFKINISVTLLKILIFFRATLKSTGTKIKLIRIINVLLRRKSEALIRDIVIAGNVNQHFLGTGFNLLELRKLHDLAACIGRRIKTRIKTKLPWKKIQTTDIKVPALCH